MFIWFNTFVTKMINFLLAYIPTLYLDTSKGEQSAPLIKHEDEWSSVFLLIYFSYFSQAQCKSFWSLPCSPLPVQDADVTDRCWDCSVWTKNLKAKIQPGAVSPMDLLSNWDEKNYLLLEQRFTCCLQLFPNIWALPWHYVVLLSPFKQVSP